MTDIEAKARALVADVVAETRPDYTGSPWNSSTILNEALYRAIEQHEAFKQEVSDVVEGYLDGPPIERHLIIDTLRSLIIPKPKPKPDPLVEVMKKAGWADAVIDSCAPSLSAALDALGFEIREKNDG